MISRSSNYAVADCGLKALGMDHGDPTIDGYRVWFCSDEHVTFGCAEGDDREAVALPRVGDRIRVVPAHVDPTVAYHERVHLVSGEGVVESWSIDLRGW